MEKDKQEFLNEFGHLYGYPNGPKSIDQIRSTEFKRLGDLVYLDHAGATLYSELQMEAVFKDLTTGVYGNPHSQSDSSNASCDVIREARQQVLEYFNASPKDYKCIFTSGATGALKLVGEAFPWSQQSLFMYTMENHNSVLGIREYALDRGATACAIDIEEPLDDQGISRSMLTSTKVYKHTMQQRNLGGDCGVLEEKSLVNANNLFAFPSECNFSGTKFSLDLVNIIKEQPERILEHSPFSKANWFVLIDAAKGCVTEPPDLSKYPADFVVLSFYKLFGYPTGLGALIARNDSAKLLRKTYFSGGTVSASIADVDFVKRREAVEEMFEDGTASYLSIASIRHGFRILSARSTCAMSKHMTSLATYVREILSALKHGNGVRVCMLYGSHSSKKLGPIVTFNLRRPDGSWYGYREVEKLASLSGIQLRTGCFCNPGACAKYLGLSHLDIKSNVEAGHVCWDDKDIIHGKPTGAVRVSFGYMSSYEDAKRFIDFVTNYFVSSSNQSGSGCQLTKSMPSVNEGPVTSLSAASYLKSIVVYPIKSCAGFAIDRWPLGSSGLQYDREWVLQSLTGEILTQKKVPTLRLINTFIDLNQDILCVESPHCREKLKIDINSNFYYGGMQEIDMQAQRYKVLAYNDEVNCWFSSVVGRPCALLRLYKPIYNRPVCTDLVSKLNFANTAEFLLISEASVSDLNKRLSSNVHKGLLKEAIQVSPVRFRPNLVISGGEPYAEDGWTILRIGKLFFRSLGGCNRCQMINLNNDSELQKSREPLATLASYRRAKGRILFGILLGFEPDDNEAQDSEHWIHVGEEVNPDTE